jgi:UDPglucose 6-dehydrogenase
MKSTEKINLFYSTAPARPLQFHALTRNSQPSIIELVERLYLKKQSTKECLMDITVIGSGYVGLVASACFAKVGHNVWCMDNNEDKVESLKRGECPIFEPGLPELLQACQVNDRLHFTTSLNEALLHASVVFIAVGTPEGEDGSADLSHILATAHSIGQHLSKPSLVVIKSTVPVGTSAEVVQIIRKELDVRELSSLSFEVASNPEFLKEGHALDDFLKPDRVIIGVEREQARSIMKELYRPFGLDEGKVLFMDRSSAELAKYAANAMLATRISFMNDIANLCEKVGADIDMIRLGIGSDKRIGSSFLNAGCGYGGSCFPKDVKALIATGEKHGCSLEVLKAVEDVNFRQKRRLFQKIFAHFSQDLAGKTIALWGLAFKPDTDDMREAPSLVLISSLLEAGCHVRVFDPAAMPNASRLLNDSVYFASDMYDAVQGADALVLVTEWNCFRSPDWAAVRRAMNGNAVFDGRNIFSRNELADAGFAACRIG